MGSSLSSPISPSEPAPRRLRLWQPHEAPNRPYAAVCLAGQLRTLSYERVQANLQAVVLRPLQAALFMHVSPEVGQAVSKCYHSHKGLDRRTAFDNCSAALSTSRTELDSILRRLHPASLSLLDDSELLRTHHLPQASAAAAGVPPATGVPLMLRLQDCLADVDRFETETRRELAWVVRMRPDLMWACQLPPPSTWQALKAASPHTVAVVYRDWMGAFSRGAAARAGMGIARHVSTSDSPCRRRGSYEHPICLDAALEAANASWCELGHTLVVQREVACDDNLTRSTAADERRPVAITGGIVSQPRGALLGARTAACHFFAADVMPGSVPAMDGLAHTRRTPAQPLPTCRLCAPALPWTDSAPTEAAAAGRAKLRVQLAGGRID